MHPIRRLPVARLPVAATLLVAVALTVAACTSTKHVSGSQTPLIPLPAGELSSFVIQPDAAPGGMVPLLKGTGEVALERYASLFTDPSAKAVALRREGFIAAYNVEYADASSGQYLVITVADFRTSRGAKAELASGYAAERAAHLMQVTVAAVGSQSAAWVQPNPHSSSGQLVTLRFRIGPLDYLVVVGADQPVNPSAISSIGLALVTQAEQALTAQQAQPGPSESL